jgi:hypothetical protein
MMGFIAPYTFTRLGTTDNYSAVAILHTVQFTVAHALGLSVFTSPILATDLSRSHCHFKSRMKSFLHSLIHFFSWKEIVEQAKAFKKWSCRALWRRRRIHFLPLFCSCQFRRLDSIQLICSQAHIPAGWRLETQLFTLLDYRLLFFVASSDYVLL